MADMYDYLLWRGDIPFTVNECNAIDAMILCQILYLCFDGIVQADFKESITIGEAAKRYNLRYSGADKEKPGALINPKSVELLTLAGKTGRFSQAALKGFINRIDSVEEKQFAAFTVTLYKNKHCIVFRGTDDTLAGWKEDFNLSFSEVIPSQSEAVHYLNQAASFCGGSFYVTGHSKGGNLALYASVFANGKAAKRIKRIFLFDSPGFNETAYAAIQKSGALQKVNRFIPQSSVIGVLLNNPKECTIVQSTEKGIRQHDIFSWQVQGTKLIVCGKRSKDSIFIEKTVTRWLSDVSPEGRKDFVNALFSVLYASGAQTLLQLGENRLQNSAAVIKAFHALPAKTRIKVFNIIKHLFKAMRANSALKVINLFPTISK